MKFLSVCMALCSLLALSKAMPVNATDGSRQVGLCQSMMEKGSYVGGSYIPECDSEGNYVAQQCCSSTGYCWCVNIFTGDEIHNTRGLLIGYHYDCYKVLYCPKFWSQYGSRCYRFIGSPMPWIQAENYCNFEGGNLASVHSYQEYHDIQTLTRGTKHEFPLTWLGAHDAIKNGFWMWNDGSKFDYEHWDMSKPMDKSDNCLMMNYGYDWKWFSAPCEKPMVFVCSKELYYYR